MFYGKSLRYVSIVATISLFLSACGASNNNNATGTTTGGTTGTTGGTTGTTGGTTGTPGGGNTAGLKSINHIIFMFQENRSFDHYFGKLNDYRALQGLPPDVDGIPPQGFSNPSYDGTFTVPSFKLKTACMANPSPSWNESHVDFNRNNPSSNTPTMDGFVRSAAAYSRDPSHPDSDSEGYRAMGYYDWNELNYYYFMATAYATSDRWYSPAPARSPPNRYYGFAATSEGRIDGSTSQLKAKTIFQSLEEAGVTWKIYVADGTNCTKADCHSPKYATTYDWILARKEGHIVGMKQYFEDLKSGNFPQVALVESVIGQDEHPGEGNNLLGQIYVSKVINAFVQSPVYKDGVFVLTYDEFGGLYDHVPPISVPNPDGIKPMLVEGKHVAGDFDRTGFRLPVIVVSPFAKPHYVSHVPTDFTSILKLIEVRFSLPNLTLRDAVVSDMTDFFDFTTPTGPLAAAPTPPTPAPSNTLPCNGSNLGYPPTP
jgi:phospholipase C